MDIVLIAGLWLPRSVWADVVTELEQLGHRTRPVALPGVDDGSANATLREQLDAVLDAIDESEEPVVVGHSAACTLAWMAAEQRPDSVRKVVLIGGFPANTGEAYADFFPAEDGVMAFPGWEPFEGADSADLSDDDKHRVASMAVPVPEGVSKGSVQLDDERRFDVPVVLVCPEFSPDDARGWIESGQVPEMAQAKNVSFVDIDTGHWPMVTNPDELARILDAATQER